MGQNERDFIDWLTVRRQSLERAGAAGAIAIGDDMGAIAVGERQILVSSDLMLEGVHFETSKHSFEMIGRKAVACNLSDCAAMAVRPRGVVVSLAMPKSSTIDDAKAIIEGVIGICGEFDCVLIGGDTTGWKHGLVIDVAVVAEPYPGIDPIRRSGARVGDGIFVTGKLGGSIHGRHLSFTPRVKEAHKIALALGEKLHAMMDISDGLGIDLDRMMKRSNKGAKLERLAVMKVASTALRDVVSNEDKLLVHVLSDGEDYELLLTANIDESLACELGLVRLGIVTKRRGLRLDHGEGVETPLFPIGWQHF
jgi:thiamine-monophosphate kinase